MSRSFFSMLPSAFLLAATGAAQGEDRTQRWLQNCDRHWNSDRARFCEVRESSIRAASTLSVDGRDNGGVSFFGWDRNDVKVVAMIQTSADNDAEAEALSRQVKIETGSGRVRAEGPSSRGRRSWSVSYHVYVPRQSNLQAVTKNGGVSAQQVEGTMEFEATNGGVDARLTGTTWKGRGLDLRTTNGGVSIRITRDYNARLETGTVNGGMSVDFPITVRGRIGRHVETQLGSGGPLVRAITTNGGVKISEL